jgi:hypothetical protein
VLDDSNRRFTPFDEPICKGSYILRLAGAICWGAIYPMQKFPHKSNTRSARLPRYKSYRQLFKRTDITCAGNASVKFFPASLGRNRCAIYTVIRVIHRVCIFLNQSSPHAPIEECQQRMKIVFELGRCLDFVVYTHARRVTYVRGGKSDIELVCWSWASAYT